MQKKIGNFIPLLSSTVSSKDLGGISLIYRE